MGLITYFARHRTIANLLLVILVVAGVIAASNMRAQYFPDVILNEVNVTVTWDGAGAEDVDRAIVQVLEPVFLTIDGVAEVSSRASEGRANITLEFEPNVALTAAEDEVQSAVDAVNTLPDGADDPVVASAAWRDRVTDVLISGPVGVDQLARFADEFTGRLFAAGITRATISGLAAPETVVEVSSNRLMQHDITMSEVASAIGAAVTDAPAGELGEGARLRTGSQRRTVAEIAAIPLRSLPDGSTLTVGDIATIRANSVNSVRAAFVGDNPAMTIRVDRVDDGDAIRMQATVAEVAAEMQTGLPPGVTVDLVRTRAEQISDRLVLLIDNGLTGLALVLALLFLFLNARIAFWVAAGIPVAMIASLAGMWALGLTLNMMSLFALIIMLGIVVDDAIVVGEHADFRVRKLGETPAVAAENAARWMAAPVFASSITTIIAFLGLLAVGGRFGDLILAIPITVVIVLIASLIECFLILPNHLKHALRPSGQENWYDWPSTQVNRGMVWLGANVVRPVTHFVIVARYPVLAAAVLALAVQAAMFLRGDVQFRFFAPPEQASVSGSFAMLPGAAREDTLAMLRELQRAADVVTARFEAEHGRNPATFMLAEIGGGAGRSLSGADTKGPDQLGSISMELISPDLRPYPTSAFIAALNEEVVPHPLLEELSFRNAFFGPGGASLSVDLYGGEAETLKAAAEALKAALAVYPEVSGLEDTLSYDKEELILTLTPQGESLGFDTATLARALRERLGGIEAATYPDGPRQASIRVELPDDELTADFLNRSLIRAAAGVYVPLSDIVAVESRSGFSTVRRENGLRLVSVTGDLAEDDPARATEVQRALKEDILPRIAQDFGLGWQLSGQAANEREFMGGAAVALVLCLLGIYLALAWIFAHWTRPLVVMAVIPFGLVGAIFGHWFWGMPLSMFSIVGLIGMVGIIINDSIVLVSTIDQYSERRGLRPAIIDGVVDRFRPVLLTTLTTVLGLTPLLYERSSQAEFLKPTVITLVFGLAFGMVLVLIVVPALMAAQADIARTFRTLKRALRAGPRGLRMAMIPAVAGMAALAVALPFWSALTGGLPGWILAISPGLAEVNPGVAAVGLFLLGALVLWLAAVIASLVGVRPRRG
ncbi:efflux RND transporter permease subunit [Tabrizicola sp.]|uniref:efflux RND transporter permease subunit n=1 Tax=Tabrizicola sp. TaxID=2005166 RepID=UPI0026247AC5|nr:efflux RND transporter permease subunit [Tabrizicola sp.]MDM7933385.1 efflux RND transporter permease subunit [Tabrizicola sp.]